MRIENDQNDLTLVYIKPAIVTFTAAEIRSAVGPAVGFSRSTIDEDGDLLDG